eukprot:62590-Prymnesium_polylepis.1
MAAARQGQTPRRQLTMVRSRFSHSALPTHRLVWTEDQGGLVRYRPATSPTSRWPMADGGARG